MLIKKFHVKRVISYMIIIALLTSLLTGCGYSVEIPNGDNDKTGSKKIVFEFGDSEPSDDITTQNNLVPVESLEKRTVPLYTNGSI